MHLYQACKTELTRLSQEKAQLIGSQDRMGRISTRRYDARGDLVNVTIPALGTTTYTRDELGSITQITDLRGHTWQFDTSSMGRFTARTDPLGRRQQYEYDQRGRRHRVIHTDGSTSTTTYDAAGRVTRREHAPDTVLDYAYDAVGRLLSTNHLSLDYDELGNNLGSDGQACADCHTATGGDNPVPLTRAFHIQCKGCHQALNAAGDKTPPVMCGQCHVR